MPKKRKHKLRHARSALATPHWAIHPPALAEMDAILREDASEDPDPEAVSQRLGMARPGESRMRVVNGVAVIPVTGVLQPKPNILTRIFGGTATSQVESDVKQAAGDTQVRSIVLIIDSPGGSAIGNEEVSKVIVEAREKKTITAYVRGMAASAAYYLASAAERIVASPSSSIGSIGTIYVHADLSAALKDIGIDVTNVVYGQYKADGSPYVKFDEQARKTLQDYVDSYGEQFTQAVARGRNVSVETVKSQYGQGKVFIADEALNRGMIDEIGAIDNLMAPRPEGDDDPDDDDAIPDGVVSVPGLTVPVGVAAMPAMTSSIAFAGQPGGVAQSNHQPAASAATTQESKMDKRIKAALFARGLIADIEASDEVCQAAVTGYFRGQVPEQESEILDALNGVQAVGSQQQTAADNSTSQAQDANPPNNAQVAHDREIKEARAEAVRLDRERRQNIEASGRLLGVAQEQVQAAVDSEDNHDQIIARWHQEMANQEPPVDTGHVNVTGEGADRFATDAVDALLMRSGFEATSQEPSQEATRLQTAPLAHVARQCLSLSGRRVDALDDPEQVALEALQMAGSNVAVISATGPAYNRPGDFPNLLSALAGKMLDQAIQIAEPTYPAWTGRLPDLADFKPKTIVGLGHFDELDEVMDDEDFKSLQMNEELVGWIQAGRYGNKVGLTPVMVANDDLDAFTQGLRTLAMAHEHTLNRLCLALITGNVTLLDGNSLFDDTNHGNYVESGHGGAPSQAQIEAMRLKHRTQTGIGDVGKVRTPPRVALVPPSLEEAAEQTLLPLRFLPETKGPTTDATINVHRGKIIPVTEPELEDSSTAEWYTFADPRVRRSIVHAFQRGYGRGGRRSRWFDPNRKTMYVDLEGRFAAAVAGHRGAVKNHGS